MAGRDLSGELFGSAEPAKEERKLEGRDLSADLFGDLKKEAPKAKPKSTDEDYGVGTFALDALKKLTGSLVGGTGSAPEGIEEGVRGGIRSAATGESALPGAKLLGLAGMSLADKLGFSSIQNTLDSKDKAGVIADRALNAVPKIPGLRGLSDYAYGVQKNIEDSISDIGKERIEGSTPTGNILKGELSFGDDPTVSGYALQAAGVLGSMAPIIATSILTKDPSKAISRSTVLGGGMAAGEGSKNARDKLGELSTTELYDVSPYFKNLVDNGIKPDQAKEMTIKKASETGAMLQGMVGALGSNVTSRILSGAFDRVIAKAGSSALGRGVATAGATGLEEGLGEVGEGIAANLAVQKVLPSQELGEDSAANLVLGALGGAGPGGVKGALTRPEEKTKLQTGSVLDKLGQEEEDVRQPITQPSGAGAGMAGEPPAGVPAGGAAESDASGVVPAGSDVGSADARTEPRPGALTPDQFRTAYNELRNEALELISLKNPTPADGQRLSMVQRDLNEVVDDNAGLLKDPELIRQLKNPMFFGGRIIDAVIQSSEERAPTQSAPTLEAITAEFMDQGLSEDEARVQAQLYLDRSQPRAMQGDMFGRKDYLDLTNRALSIGGKDPVKAVAYLRQYAQSLRDRLPKLAQDSMFGYRYAEQFGLEKNEGYQNPAQVAKLYVQREEQRVAESIQQLQGTGQPRAMQGDLFGAEDTTDAEAARLDAVLQAREQQKQRSESGFDEEFGAEDGSIEEAAPVEGAAPVEEAAPATQKAAPVVAPDVTTEHIPQTKEGAELVGFFDAIQPAADSASEQERFGNSKNTAASTMLEYDVAAPGEETSEGARKMLNYLAGRVGGMDNLRALVAALRNADPQQQSALFKRAGLPDLTSRRGMDAFSAEVQSYADQVGGTKGGVRIGSAALYSGRPYTETIQSTRAVTQVFAPTSEGKPRRPSQGQAETSHVIFDRKLRAAVLAIKQAIAAGAKLSPQQQAAVNYLNSTNRETFGEALYDLAYDLAYYELDPKNNGANSTFAGEGGRFALAFQQWIKDNLDKSTFEVLNDMVNEHKQNAAENERFAKAVTRYHEQLDTLAEDQRKSAEKRTKRSVARAPKKKVVRIGDIEEVEPAAVDLTKNLPSVQMVTEIHPALRRLLEQGKTTEALQILADAKGNTYYAALAQRLLDAGLTAQTRLIDGDTMESLSNDPAIKQSLDEHLDTLRQIVVDLYPVEQQATIIAGLRSSKLREVLSAIRTVQSTIEQNNALPGNIEALENTIDLLNRQFAWDGKYDPKSDSIVLRSGVGKLTNHLFLHEALHAAASHLLDNHESLTGIQRQAYDQLNELYEHAKKVLSADEFAGEKIYGLQDLHEFVSEALTNPVFQAQLRNLRYKAAPYSLWNSFTEAIRKLFNVKKGYESNVMVETMLATDAMIAGPMSLEGLTATSGPKAMASKKITRLKPMRQGMPNQPSAIGRLMTGRSWSAGIKREFSSLSASARPTALGVLTLRQLDDLIAGRLPQISNFIKVTEDFLSRKNRVLQEAGDISRSWEALQAASPEMSQQLGTVMHMATIKEVDPDKAGVNQRNANQDLMLEWNKLDPKAKQIYRDVRDFYARRYSDYKLMMRRRIIQMRQLGVSEATITEIRNEFEQGSMKGPYFPLMRFGRFWYQIGKGTSREYYMFESEAARDRHIDERLQKDPHLADTIGANIGNDFTKQMDYHARESKFLKAVFDAVDSMDVTGLTPTQAEAKKKELKDNYYQTYLQNQPDRSMRNQFIHRNNVAGYSEDALRSFATSSFNMAYQLARFQYSPEMFSQLEAARMQLKDRYDPAVGYDPVVVKENDELRDYVGEVDRRLNLMLNPTDIGTIPSTLSNVGFVYYLSSVASAITNILGGVIIGVPTLIGQQVKANPKMGYTSATGKVLYETSKSFAQIMMTGFNVEVGERVRDSRLLSPSFDRSDALSSTERAAYNRFIADGLIDITSTYDQSGLASTPTENYSGLRNKSMQVLTYAFHHAERLNREVMAMSAFRAAMEKREGMKNRQQAFAESIAEAKSLTQRAMFDYSATNKPRFFQHPVARIVLQFKQFPQQMTFFLAHNLLNSIKDLPIEQKREARARFVGTMGMSAIFSGVTGIWGFSTVASIVNAVFNIAGEDDDEEPFDFELAFVNWANETFGANMGTAITRGSLNALTGLDIGSRVKLDEMWFRDGRKNQDEVESLQTFLVDLLGPTIGIGVSAARAVDLWNQGHGDRAIEAISPAFIKNAMIAQRMSREGGASTLRGDMLTENPSPFILMMQGLGLRSQELAERQYYNITVKGQEQEVLKKRQNLLNYYGLTFMANDIESNEKAFEKIMEFNDKHPSVRIPADSITGSIIERMKKSAQTENGLYIDKRLRESLTRQNYLANQ